MPSVGLWALSSFCNQKQKQGLYVLPTVLISYTHILVMLLMCSFVKKKKKTEVQTSDLVEEYGRFLQEKEAQQQKTTGVL